MMEFKQLQYTIWDPTGNITALVETPTEVADQPALAAELMARHPEVEQVGFLRFPPSENARDAAELRMAGGEFCGNASISAAALRLLRRGLPPVGREAHSLWLKVSGAAEPVEARVRRVGEMEFSVALRMPPAQSVEQRVFSYGSLRDRLPLIRMQGISHVLIEPESPLFLLRDSDDDAERAAREWCDALGAACLGLMFLSGSDPDWTLTPLVWVPCGETLCWEHSCASGSAAVGLCLALREGKPQDLSFQEPGGVLRVECQPGSGEVWLHGNARIVEGT